MSELMQDGPICLAVLDFKTKAHSHHVCCRKQYHSIQHADERAKHGCVCGLTWTHDARVAGKNWSQEIDLTPTIDKECNHKENNDPN